MYVVMSKLKDRIYPDNKHIIKFVMRKIVLSLFALCCFSAVMAQQKIRNLSVELLPKILWASTTTVDSTETLG